MELNIIYCRTIKYRKGWRKLLKEYTYTTDSGETIVVNNGFEWNGASTPSVFKWLIPKFEKTLEASCIHDWLCATAKNKDDRKRADSIFREMLKKKGMWWPRRTLGWLGVRIGALFSINGSKKSWE